MFHFQTLRFSKCNNVEISGLTSLNSQLYHIDFDGCHNVKLQGVKVSAPGNSPNTDGIHVQSSSVVSIMNSRIATGDDCVSIGPGTNGLWIENIACGPGHGIRYIILYIFCKTSCTLDIQYCYLSVYDNIFQILHMYYF